MKKPKKKVEKTKTIVKKQGSSKNKQNNKSKSDKKGYFNFLAEIYNTRKSLDSLLTILPIDKNRLDQLLTKYKLVIDRNDDGIILINDNTGIGTLTLTSHGNGYVKIEDREDDIFLYGENLNRAFDGDTVSVLFNTHNGRVYGEVISIINRSKTNFICTIDRRENFGYAVSKNAKMYTDIYIGKDNLLDCETNDVVVVEFIKWDDEYVNPHGKVTNVIGKAGDHETELHAILQQYGFPYEFPAEVLVEANAISPIITDEEISKRRDMRKVSSFVIDPIGARDKDDAISFEDLGNGIVEIGVHIADLTHYVKEGTELYKEAFKRSTSVYLVDRCIPMLPEVLSNNICSLHPNEDKLAFSVVFKFNEAGVILDKWYGKTIIHIDGDYSYEDAFKILSTTEYNNPFELAVHEVNKKAVILRDKRTKQDTLIFNKSEVKFKLDDKNEPIDVYEKKQNVANYLIEEFMLLANESVGEYIYKAIKRCIFRHHPEPTMERIAELSSICKLFGHAFDESNVKKSINDLMIAIKDTPEENMLNTLAIRSMSKAVYSATDKGHWGLGEGFGHYTHFTSPIRRMSDMISHNLLSVILDGEKSKTTEMMLKTDAYCDHINAQERQATSAERDSIKYMQIKYLEARKDQVFDGVISGITDTAMYVELTQSKCEGTIMLRDMGKNCFFDKKSYTLTLGNQEQSYRLGDKIMVKVKKTDLLKKQIDLKII